MEEIRRLFRDTPRNFQHAENAKIEEHVYYLKVDIHKGCYGFIQCWKRLMPTIINHWINSFMCYDCL